MARPKQDDLPSIEGEGVAPVKDKKLNSLCDKFIDIRDSKALMAEELTAVEKNILERMDELKITVHRFGDQIAQIKPGKSHVKIKTVQTATSAEDADNEGED